MAVTVLSVAISCSRSAGSPGSLVTMPEVMIITGGFNPTCGIEIYEPRGRKKRIDVNGRREIVPIRKKSRRRERWEKSGAASQRGEQRTMI